MTLKVERMLPTLKSLGHIVRKDLFNGTYIISHQGDNKMRQKHELDVKRNKKKESPKMRYKNVRHLHNSRLMLNMNT